MNARKGAEDVLFDRLFSRAGSLPHSGMHSKSGSEPARESVGSVSEGEESDDFQTNLVLTQQLRQRRYRLLIGDQTIDQADRTQSNHRITPELA